jgi:8-oxo-dGTP diphosphatase
MMKVTAAIIEKNGRVLIARRKPGKNLAGFWEFPGGKIEAGESPEDCLRRELFEELSINVNVGRFVAKSIYQYQDLLIQLLAYQVEIQSGEVKLVDHDCVEWVTLDEIDNYQMAPADLSIVVAYKKIQQSER